MLHCALRYPDTQMLPALTNQFARRTYDTTAIFHGGRDATVGPLLQSLPRNRNGARYARGPESGGAVGCSLIVANMMNTMSSFLNIILAAAAAKARELTLTAQTFGGKSFPNSDILSRSLSRRSFVFPFYSLTAAPPHPLLLLMWSVDSTLPVCSSKKCKVGLKQHSSLLVNL